ncbi:MAG: T9SS type A sorting domain-containing protein [Candidatus Kapabacteria bacterium]|nr:T9SS type A sorting domain-containing protein [Candidatus Kapabacteria bacterium]
MKIFLLTIMAMLLSIQCLEADNDTYIHKPIAYSKLLPDSVNADYEVRDIIRIDESTLLAAISTQAGVPYYFNIFIQSNDNGQSWFEVIKWSDAWSAGENRRINSMDYNQNGVIIVANNSSGMGPNIGCIYKINFNDYTLDTICTGYQINSPEVKFITDSLVYIFYNHGLIKSNDCGNTWEQVLIKDNNGVVHPMREFQIIDKDHLYFSSDMGQKQSNFIRTTDGGHTWNTSELPARVSAMNFIDSEYGWIAGWKANSELGGTIADYSYHIFKTEDGGQSWESILDSNYYYDTPNFKLHDFRWIKFINENVGIYYLNQNSLFPDSYTLDGGKTWKLWESFTQLTGIFFLNEFEILLTPRYDLNVYNLKIDPTSVETDYSNLDNLMIHPNPATEYIEIQTSEVSEISILNLLGEIVSSINLESQSNRIDVSSLAHGMYFIKIGNKVQKFIKL